MAKYFEVTILGEKNAQLVVNRLNFTSNNDEPLTANSMGLIQALGFTPSDHSLVVADSVLRRLLIASTVSYRINEIIVRNLHSTTDFITQPVTGTDWQGDQAEPAGDQTPTFIAAKLRTNRVRSDIRRGTMSLTGGTEEHMESGSVWGSSYLALLTSLCAALNLPPSHTSGGATTQFIPSVFGKERYVVPDSDPVRFAYRYYTDFTLFQANVALGVTWSAVPQVSSQVSRKIGRGA